MKRLVSLFSIVILVFTLFWSCSEKELEIPVASITISQPAAEMIEGETIILKATFLPSNATVREIIWASSKQSVATIDQSGKVVAVAEGTSTITATAGGKVGSCVVTVSKRVVDVSSIILDKTSASLKVGEKVSLTATVKPDDATDKTVTWSTSDASIATISDGVVTAIKLGSAIITVKAGDKEATCAITVEPTPVTSITLDKTGASLKVGEKITLTVTIKPDDATDKTVTWSTSDASVATVDNGVVTAIKLGSATITAKAGDKEATCAITVEPTPVTSITLDKTSASLKVGEKVTLTATVKPDDATDKTIIWSTSDASVATISDGVVTAIKLGSATITAKAGDKEATCAITVEPTPVTSITLDKTSASLKVGEKVTLTATVKPDDATDKTVTWRTSDASVATVTNGVVTAKKLGTATITAKAGDKEATCSITVKAIPVSSITLNKTSVFMRVNKIVVLTATVKPDDATDKTVTWSTSDASVATVEDGVVTAHKLGSATIAAQAGDKEATCSITVEATPVSSITLDRTSAFLNEGETITLTATVEPDDATDKTVTWSTSDASVATVEDGVVTAVKPGTASITVKANDGSNTSATCVVEVKQIVTGITLDNASLSLVEGETYTLVATVSPANASDKTLTWTSSDESVATVNGDGLVTAKSKGKTTIKAKANDGSGSIDECSVTVSSPCPAGAVDLGMTTAEGYKLYWATCNVCETGFVSSPEEYGDYYAWGEIETYYSSLNPLTWKEGKFGYEWNTYQWTTSMYTNITKYNTLESAGLDGFVDNKTELSDYNYEDDVARQKLGGSWRIPTDAEWTALRTQCTWTWTTQNGVNGRLVTAPNGNSIFLPAAGHFYEYDHISAAGQAGAYWSSSINPGGPISAYYLPFGDKLLLHGSDYRARGNSVRAVSD